MSVKEMILGGLLIGASAFAEQTVDLKPGASVTLDRLSEKTTVSCEGTAPKCLCVDNYPDYEVRFYPYNVVLQRRGTREKCQEEINRLSECH